MRGLRRGSAATPEDCDGAPWSAELVCSHLTVRDSDTGKHVPPVFADKRLLTAGYRIRPIDIDLGWRLNGYFAASNDPPRDSSNQLLIDQSFKTCDVFVGWRPRAHPDFTINGGLRNAFNQKMIRPGYAGTTTQVGMGRSTSVELAYRF